MKNRNDPIISHVKKEKIKIKIVHDHNFLTRSLKTNAISRLNLIKINIFSNNQINSEQIYMIKKNWRVRTDVPDLQIKLNSGLGVWHQVRTELHVFVETTRN
jgi:hypothetical protein